MADNRTEEERQRAEEIEGYLALWAHHVRGHVELGYPKVSLETDHIYGNGRPVSEWPPEVHAVESAVCAMTGRMKEATIYYYVRHMPTHRIAKKLHCGYDKAGKFVEAGREYVAGWLRIHRVA